MTETARPKSPLGLIGTLIGAVAFLLTLIHFWAGPFSPQPTMEQSVAESAVKIRDAAIRAVKGEEPPAPKRPSMDLDRATDIASASLAGIAIVFGIVGFIRHESSRPAIAAVGLGASAIVFQLVTWLALLFVGALLLYALLANFGEIVGFS